MFSDLQWFTGLWIGDADELTIEEHWSAARGEVFMGMFRMLREARPAFYEFMTLAIEGDEIILRIKHFNPGLQGWETQDESVIFVLVGLEAGKAIFYQRNVPNSKWMIYQKEGSDLFVYFENLDGEVPGGRLRFLRV